MRKVHSLLVSYAAVLLLSPLIFRIFRLAGAQLFSAQLLAAHPWLAQVTTYTPVALLLFIFLKATLRPAKHFGFRDNRELLWTSVAIGAASAVALYFLDTASGFFVANNIHTNPGLLVAAGYLFSWGLLGPFVEEWFFRGLVQTALTDAVESSSTIHPAVWLTVTLEILFHIAPNVLYGIPVDWLQLLYVGVFGLAASVVYMRTKSLLGPFLIHAVGNAGELLLFWLL